MKEAQKIPPLLASLFQRRQSGLKFSLDGIRNLCAALGNPQHHLSFIHIAGTNGKGSVAAMCASILQETGLRIGLYTSPHLLRYHERFRINGQEISDMELESLLKRIMKLAGNATFFEISTALAFDWFHQKNIQIVVLETGLGGRLDATNIITPFVSVITHIGLEHTQLLGKTVEKIAKEKAGVIKPYRPVITPTQNPKILAVLKKKAHEQKSPLKIIRASDLDKFESPLAGNHQRWNTALAVATTKWAYPSLTNTMIRQGLKKTMWPGRCQLIKRTDGLSPILIDGAHNPLGARALAREIERRWGHKKAILIFGALADKNFKEMGKILSPMASKTFLTKVSSERSATLSQLSNHISSQYVFQNLHLALAKADEQKQPIVIAGSLFLAVEAILLLAGKRQVLHPNESFICLCQNAPR